MWNEAFFIKHHNSWSKHISHMHTQLCLAREINQNSLFHKHTHTHKNGNSRSLVLQIPLPGIRIPLHHFISTPFFRSNNDNVWCVLLLLRCFVGNDTPVLILTNARSIRIIINSAVSNFHKIHQLGTVISHCSTLNSNRGTPRIDNCASYRKHWIIFGALNAESSTKIKWKCFSIRWFDFAFHIASRFDNN